MKEAEEVRRRDNFVLCSILRLRGRLSRVKGTLEKFFRTFFSGTMTLGFAPPPVVFLLEIVEVPGNLIVSTLGKMHSRCLLLAVAIPEPCWQSFKKRMG